MNIEKAIEVLEADYQAHHDIHDPLPAIAIKLGIEALKRTQTRREQLSWKLEPLLPGETED